MPTISEQLQSLVNDKRQLVEILNEKGVEASENETFTSLVPKVENISGGDSGKKWTGHCDAEGLRQIGWTDEEIEFFQEHGVCWDDVDDNYYKLRPDELTLDYTTVTKGLRFMPRSSNMPSMNGLRSVIGHPFIDGTITSTNYANANSVTSWCVRQKPTSISFQNDYSLTYVEPFDLSGIRSLSSTFAGCYSLREIPNCDYSKLTSLSSVFKECFSLKKVENLDVSNSTSLLQCFNTCSALEEVNGINAPKCANANQLFANCKALKCVKEINAPIVQNMGSMFLGCSCLTEIWELNAGNVSNISSAFGQCYCLKNFGGLIDLGKGFPTTTSANNSSCKLDLSYAHGLTYTSLMNILNGLYDLNIKGINTQTILFSTTSKGILTAEEIAIATNKGWTVS